jgi:DEAD/DEAH box helicase domain-containing protein
MMAEPRDLGRAVGDGDAKWLATVGSNGRGQMRDVSGTEVAPDHQGRFRPTVFLYDNYPGGIGLSAPLFDLAEELVGGAQRLIADCPCCFGCPSCVGPILVSDEQRGYSAKALALRVLAHLSVEGSADSEWSNE